MITKLKIKTSILSLQKFYCKGPFSAITRDHRSNKWSTRWSLSLSLCFGLHHLPVLSHWKISHCIIESCGGSSTSPFHLSYYFFFQVLHTGTLGKTRVVWQLGQWFRQYLGVHYLFFKLSCSLFLSSDHVLFVGQNPWKSRIYKSYCHNICIWEY